MDPKLVLKDARSAPTKTDLVEHLDAIRALREKKWAWRDIADFLSERGVDTDHTKLIRFMQKVTEKWTVPSAGEYLRALTALKREGKIKEPWWAMLTTHYQAHNRTITYTELALAAARSGARLPESRIHTYANREYGTLGKTLGQEMGMEFLPGKKKDTPFYSSAIGIGSAATPPDGDFELVMHHELAKAIDQLMAIS